MLDRAHKVFEEMPQLRYERTSKSFTSLVAACVNAKEIEIVEEFFRGLPQKVSIEGDWISYKIVVYSACEMGSLVTAFFMLDEWEKNGLELDSVTLNTLFYGFYNNGRVLDKEKIWCVGKVKKVILDIRSYNSRMSGSCNDGKLEEAERWYQNMMATSETSGKRTWKPPWCSASGDMAAEEILYLTTIFSHDFSWSLLICIEEEVATAIRGGILAGTGTVGDIISNEHTVLYFELVKGAKIWALNIAWQMLRDGKVAKDTCKNHLIEKASSLGILPEARIKREMLEYQRELADSVKEDVKKEDAKNLEAKLLRDMLQHGERWRILDLMAAFDWSRVHHGSSWS